MGMQDFHKGVRRQNQFQIQILSKRKLWKEAKRQQKPGKCKFGKFQNIQNNLESFGKAEFQNHIEKIKISKCHFFKCSKTCFTYIYIYILTEGTFTYHLLCLGVWLCLVF